MTGYTVYEQSFGGARREIGWCPSYEAAEAIVRLASVAPGPLVDSYRIAGMFRCASIAPAYVGTVTF